MLLLGNPAKADEKLGWKCKVGFNDLVIEMIEVDIKAVNSLVEDEPMYLMAHCAIFLLILLHDDIHVLCYQSFRTRTRYCLTSASRLVLYYLRSRRN